jgi:hypothetical protein
MGVQIIIERRLRIFVVPVFQAVKWHPGITPTSAGALEKWNWHIFAVQTGW